MNFENIKQELVSFPRFLMRVGRFSFYAFLMILLSVLIGTAGYRFFCDLSWIDSLYMACMILTGMGPTSEMANSGAKLFSSFYALYSGVAFLSITAVFFTPIIHRLLHILHIEYLDKDIDN
jgi:type II secretory pathway component PulF